jgi:Nucleotide-diphospho-sugar transferase
MLIVTTESHQVLLDEWFRPTMPPDAGVTIQQRHLDLKGDGGYESASWQTGVTAKLSYALDYVRSAADDTVFALSDVDIQFFSTFSAVSAAQSLDRAGVDILFQKEHRDSRSTEVNTGFYVARATPWVGILLENAMALCAEASVKNDQVAINTLLRPDDLHRSFSYLPFSYYARSQGFPPDRSIALHHANFSGTIPVKIAQLKRVREYVTGGLLSRGRALSAEGLDYVASGKAMLRAKNGMKRFKV